MKKENRKQQIPSLRPYQRHVLVCTGPNCAPDESAQIYLRLKEKVKESGLHEGARRIQRSKCHCFGICEGGPLMVVYPDDVWYHHVNEERLERIIQDHLVEGRPVTEWSFYRKEGAVGSPEATSS